MEPEYNAHIRANKHIVKGYCFLKLLGFVELNRQRRLGLDFSRVLFKLEYYLTVQYADYYLVAQQYLRNKACATQIAGLTGTKLQVLLKKMVITQQITQNQVFNGDLLAQISNQQIDTRFGMNSGGSIVSQE